MKVFGVKEMAQQKKIILLIILTATLIVFPFYPSANSQSATVQLLDPATIPKFTNQLTGPPPVFNAVNVTDGQGNLLEQDYTVKVSEFNQQILPTIKADDSPTGFPKTTVWGYQGTAKDALTGANLGVVSGTPGCTIEATQGVPVKVKWVNNLVDSAGNPLKYFLPVDSTIHWANPNGLPMGTMNMAASSSTGASALSPVPIVTHLHGGEVPSTSDGFPDSWYTPDGKHGPAYTTEESTDPNAAVYIYPNTQPPTTLWYHDHALGLTRLNVLSGLAGFYIIRNQPDPIAQMLPGGAYDMPLVLQDRSFYTNGSLYYPDVGNYPDVHPVWQPSFLGDTIIVNGLAWPNMNVDQGVYRFRILDGSNSRFYQLALSNRMPFTIICSDGGYLKTPVQLTSKLIAPAERIDILVDFSNVPAGTKIVLKDASVVNTPSNQNNQMMPTTPSQTNLTGDLMQFTVTAKQGAPAPNLPANLNPTLAGSFPTLPEPSKTRILTLTGVTGDNGNKQLLLDGQDWSAPISENPQVGSTEDWVIVNPMMEVHPIHLHLIQFQVVSRQSFDATSYMAEWTRLNGPVPLENATVNVESLAPYMTGSPKAADPSEQGWKDTVIVNPGEVVTIRARWTQEDGSAFPFDASAGPGYVWHCHLLEHEDNEMMRPYVVLADSSVSAFPFLEVAVAAAVVAAVLAAAFLMLRLRRKKQA